MASATNKTTTRTTRSKTGKLPPKKILSFAESSDEEIFEDKGPVEAKEAHLNGEIFGEAVVEYQAPRPVFETFSTKAKLQDGVCIVRQIQPGKYELINLSKVNQESIASKVIGRQIKDTPLLLELLENTKNGWRQSKMKLDVAIASSKAGLFRFLNLPIELRYRIYDFAIISTKALHPAYRYSIRKTPIALALRGACKQIYEETQKFFFRNNFRLYTSKISCLIQTYILSNIQELSYNVWIKDKTDSEFFGMLNFECPKLKIFNLRITERRYRIWTARMTQNMNHDKPNDISYGRSMSFDALIRIRGLERINISKLSGTMTKRDLEDLETFLNAVMTQPRLPIEDKLATSKKTNQKEEKNRLALVRSAR